MQRCDPNKLYPPHIHTGHDGRPPRNVYVDGRLVMGYVEMADTKRGIVCVAMRPLRLDKHHKRVLTRMVRGNVAVEEIA